MAAAFRLGAAVRARRVYLAKTSARHGIDSYLNPTSGQYENRWTASDDDLRDIAQRRSDVGRIQTVPTSTSTYNGSRWDPTTSTQATVAKAGEYVYQVLIWDIDAGMVVSEQYPESELALVTAAEVHARHADIDRLPEDVASIRRAYEVGGSG